MEDIYVCDNCGTEVLESDIECSNCGLEFEDVDYIKDLILKDKYSAIDNYKDIKVITTVVNSIIWLVAIIYSLILIYMAITIDKGLLYALVGVPLVLFMAFIVTFMYKANNMNKALILKELSEINSKLKK